MAGTIQTEIFNSSLFTISLDYEHILYCKDISFSREFSTVETVSSGRARTFIKQYSSWTAEGTFFLSGYNTPFDRFHTLYNKQTNSNEVAVKIFLEDANTYLSGTAIITSLSAEGDVDSTATYSISLVGTGDLTLTLYGHPFHTTSGYNTYNNASDATDLEYQVLYWDGSTGGTYPTAAGQFVYTDKDLSIPFDGDDKYFKLGNDLSVITVDNTGEITGFWNIVGS